MTDDQIRAEAIEYANQHRYTTSSAGWLEKEVSDFEAGAKWHREQSGCEWMELVKAMNDYITSLGMELDDCAGLLAVHGWKSRRVQEGIDARNKILEIKERMSQPKTK